MFARIRLLSLGITALTLALTAAADVIQVADQSMHRYEWRASTYAFSAQAEAALALDEEGNLVVAWSSRRQQEGHYSVYAQRFSPRGVAIGGETQLSLWGQSHQQSPVLNTDEAGNLWAAWLSYGQDGHVGAIIARRLRPDLTGSSEICVNEQGRGHQFDPVIASNDRGQTLVVWRSTPHPKQPARLFGRLLDADGKPLTSEFTISAAVAARGEVAPAVCATSDGGFAVAYAVLDNKRKPAGIRLQRVDATGKRLGDEIDVATQHRTTAIEPAVIASDQTLVVAWLDAASDGDDYGVLARRLDLQGKPRGDAFVVNTARKGPQTAVALAAHTDGRLLIAWNSPDGDDTGIFAQCFDRAGERLGDEFRINAHTAGRQALRQALGTRRIAFIPDGAIAVAWEGDARKGDSSSVNVTLLTPAPLALGNAAQGITAEHQPASGARSSGLAEPHIPPTFDPRDIARIDREIRIGLDIGFDAIANTGWNPPDPHLAVGPDHLVAMTNGAIAFFEKDGTLTFEDEIEDHFGFWGSEGATGFVFDPEALYDELSGRFFVMAAEGYAPGSRSYVLVAVSDDADPNGTWYKYRFETTGLAGNLFDSPNIGVDEDVVYITGDGFGISDNYPVYTFDKASLLAGNPPAIQRSLTLPTNTQSAGIPPVTFGNPPALYMLEHSEADPATTVRLIALRDPLGAPNFTSVNLNVSSYTPPEDPPQLGTSVRPNTFDARFWSVAYRNGSLWATHHVNSDRVRARWYEIETRGWPAPTGQPPQVKQWGEIDPGGSVRTFFSAITVDDQNNAAICFSRSAPDERISMATSFRSAFDPLGTFQPMEIQRSSTDADNSGRWGDYCAINVDPADGRTFWAHHEYRSAGWRTWITSFSPPVVLGDLNCDGIINNFDIDPFVLALTNPPAYQAQYPNCDINRADINGDGSVNNFDIDPFVELLN